MLTQIFKVFFITSCIGSLLAILLTLLKPITKKYFSSRWNYYIWLVVLIAMMLPLKFSLPVQTQTQTATPITTQTAVTQSADNLQAQTPATNNAPIKQNNFEVVKSLALNKLDIISYIWLVGAMFLLLAKLLGYLLFLRKIRNNSRIINCTELSAFTSKNIAVRMGNNLSSPLMIGVFKPTLLLPNIEMSEEQLNNILRHEMTHFKRNDIWCKWFAMLVKCVHFYNPIVYFVAKQINSECEISCDLAVVEHMNKEEEISYIGTILDLLSKEKSKNIPLTTGMANSKKQIKRRFMMIKNRTKIGKIASVISVVMAVVMLTTTVFASGILANAIIGEKNVVIDGVAYDIKPVFVENSRYLHTDSYYLPLRDIFKALGCAVNYDVDRNKLSADWQINGHTPTFPMYDWRENLVTDDITSQIYGATSIANSNMPIIEIVPKNGEKCYYQIGSEHQTKGAMTTPIIIDNKAYISLRALVYFLVPDGENSDLSISYDNQKHDTYYLGRLTWNEETKTVTINTNAKLSLLAYRDTQTKLNTDGRSVSQFIENKKYAFYLVENYSNNNKLSCLVVDKATGYVALLEDFDKEIWFKLKLNFSGSDGFLLKIRTGTDGNNTIYEDYKQWNLSECNFEPLG